MRRRFVISFALALSLAAALAARQGSPAGLRFEVSFSAAVRAEPVTGRVYVALARSVDRQPPIQQVNSTGSPLFGLNVDELAPGAAAVIGPEEFGHPIASLRNIPAGDYWVQPFVNVYTQFARADGNTVWLHMDQWEGQNWRRSPGNLYGDPVSIHLDPASNEPIRLVADKIIPPVQVPPDTESVKRIRIQSQILSKWWGQPIYLGATISLPLGYAEHPAVQYPVVYSQGHFSLNPPGVSRPSTGSGQAAAGATPGPASTGPQARLIWVSLQHPSPYYDDSYGVNSANNGPYGDAIIQELVPAVEAKFRAIREPWARLLSGGSTGGWIAIAHQIFYPDFYGGTWANCPDSVDFRYHQIVNIYDDANAYWKDMGWMRVERPNQRQPDGNIRSMMKDENWFELVVGDRSRSGGQWDIWEATYGPAGADGYPKRIWDKKTGAVDKQIAAYWKEHYDLRHILETKWATLGPKVASKLHVYIGENDSYYLDDAVHLLDDFLKKAANPPFGGEVVYQPRAPHCWGPRAAELAQKMTEYIDKTAPAGADLKSWKY
jgi:hypothetical protein